MIAERLRSWSAPIVVAEPGEQRDPTMADLEQLVMRCDIGDKCFEVRDDTFLSDGIRIASRGIGEPFKLGATISGA